MSKHSLAVVNSMESVPTLPETLFIVGLEDCVSLEVIARGPDNLARPFALPIHNNVDGHDVAVGEGSWHREILVSHFAWM